jgi:hypothetical protein
MTKHFKPLNLSKVSIIYKADIKYIDNYEILKVKFPLFKFLKESNFKEDVVNNVLFDKKYTMFLMDDNVFLSDVTIGDNEFNVFDHSDEIACISLRLNPLVDFCYTANKKMQKPTFPKRGALVWKYTDYQLDWAYPMSLDGHIFKTEDLLHRLKCLNYYCPNILEGVLAKSPIKKDYMVCYATSKVSNIPCNRVQSVSPNLFGQKYKFTEDELNDKFTKGERVDLNHIKSVYSKKAVHEEIELKFIRDING